MNINTEMYWSYNLTLLTAPEVNAIILENQGITRFVLDLESYKNTK